jgi:hypothetical protein
MAVAANIVMHNGAAFMGTLFGSVLAPIQNIQLYHSIRQQQKIIITSSMTVRA